MVHHKRESRSKLTIDEITKKDTSNSVWNITPVLPRFIEHPCPFPEELPYRLITLYTNVGDIVLDPFVGSGQTTKLARYLKRHYIGVDNIREYVEMARKMLSEAPHLREQLIARWHKVPISK